ncbi:MAG: TerB family tellurite resistance protein [Muribaculaceae bacterium]|nr:TerB family tellurite resistance protein [Muribaculaceae bacterium]
MNFNQLCKEVESLNPLEYAAIIADKTLKIVPALHALTQDYIETAGMFASFLMASVYADGKLDEAEYVLLLPALRILFGEDIDYDAAKAVARYFKPEGRELKKAVNYLVDILGELSEDLKADIITVCLLICAVDGKISFKEKNYIKQLIK